MHQNIQSVTPETNFSCTFEKTNYFLLMSPSDDIVARDIHVKEWKLVYSPINPIFDELAENAAKSLQLEGAVGVNSSEEVESAMFNRELVAGINFQHSAVI